ncbi:MAG: transglycosylase domain-containing protein [Clostridiales bacterium]|jgi:penicillin-binding protein 1A|nr:transglycosylase domain-containing protein [Clostridiales bacterium]
MDYSKKANIAARREASSTRKKVSHKIGVIVFRVALSMVLIAGFAAAGAGVGLYMGVIQNAPAVNVSVLPDIYTSIIYSAKTGEEVDRLRGEENRVYIKSQYMPDHVKAAFVAIEDERFYQHDGIDFEGLGRAVFTAIKSRFGRTEGASTITQQVIKNNIMHLMRNTVFSKLQEQYMAVNFEKMLTEQFNGDKRAAKDYILEVYINTINLGSGNYGIQTAAKNYFGKEVKDLTISEAAAIAGITKNPSKYAPDRRPEDNATRRGYVLDKMLELEFISQEQFDEAQADALYERVAATKMEIEEASSAHDYFVDAVIERLAEDLVEIKQCTEAEAYDLIYNGGLQIYITQDESMQNIMDSYIQDPSNYPSNLFEIDVEYLLSTRNTVTGETHNYRMLETVKDEADVQPAVDAYKAEHIGNNDEYTERLFAIPQPQAAMVILDYHNGYVKAINGGRGDKTDNRTLNRAVDSKRQPGSVFKVLASYAPALDMGRITSSTVIVDERFVYNGYEPKNWWGEYYIGPQTVRKGIERSMNILAVRNLVENVGIDTAFDYLLSFGFTTLVDSRVSDDGRVFTDKVPAMALGGLTDGVTALETAAAYGTIANEGMYIKPVFYSKVLDHDGNVIIDNETVQPRQVLKKSTAYLLTDMMLDVIYGSQGTGRNMAFRDTNIPIAGKTGTTSRSIDLTFAGYTPYYSGYIWSGYDTPWDKNGKPKTMEGTESYHKNLWSNIMNDIHKELEYREFTKPTGVDEIQVCIDSGLLANSFCPLDMRGSRVVNEFFSTGAQPTETCNLHTVVEIDTSTGMKASQWCPAEVRKTIYGIVVSDASYDGSDYQIKSSVYNGEECIYHGPLSGLGINPFWPGAEAEPSDNNNNGYGDNNFSGWLGDILDGGRNTSTTQATPSADPQDTGPTGDFEEPQASANAIPEPLPSDANAPIIDDPQSLDDFEN